MALREHLAELRRRVIISAIALVLGTGVGWFLADATLEHLIIEPVTRATAHGQAVTLAYRSVADAFNIKFKVAYYIGVVISSPVWIYQIWAFITPGLTRRERRNSLLFMSFALPLFLCGVALAILVLPKTIAIGADFAVKGTVNIPDFSTVLTFATRLIIALGTAFLLPLFLVGLNLTGMMSGRALGKQWRIAVFIAFLFAAIVSPSPDAVQMIILALPLVGLYVISVFVCLFNDRRKARRRAEDPVFGLPDDEASPLPELNDPVTTSGPVDSPGPMDWT
jgi:sec-independent protein translocase protein TatC